MSDEELMDFVQQDEDDLIDDIQQHIAPVHLHKENYEEMFMKYREEVLEPAAHDINMDHAMMNMDYDRDEEVDAEESIEDTSNKALEAAMEELKKLAGLEEKEKTEPCPKCGKQRVILKACASCGCS
jgi:activator of HSP90 ATPase